LLATLFSELEWTSSFDDRTELINEAVRITRGIDDRWVLATVLNRACVSSPAPHNLATRISYSAEALEIATALGDRTLQFWAQCGRFTAALHDTDRDGADSALAGALALADELGQPSFRWFARSLRTSLLLAVAHPDEAEASAEEAFAIGSASEEPDAFDFYAAQLMTARWRQGRGMEVMDLLRQAAADNPELPAYRASLAGMLGDEGNLPEAAALLSDGLAEGFECRINTSWSVTIGPWAITADFVGDADAAAVLYDLLVPWAGQLADTRSHSHHVVDSYLGLLAQLMGNHEQANLHFAEAARLTEAFGAHGWTAEDDLRRSRLHLAQGDTDAARSLAERALAGAEQTGYGLVERHALEFLATLAVP
jgi:tetratricopeptide (TPR) repeat protein